MIASLNIFQWLFYILLELSNPRNLGSDRLSLQEYITPIDAYETMYLQGFKVIVNKEALTYNETKEALLLLEEKLAEASKLVPSAQVAFLKQVPIWIEWEVLPQGAMWYHKSKHWLIANGYLGEKEKSVEINNVKNFIAWQKLNQPYMVLHELAHAYYDQILSKHDNEVEQTYRLSIKSKKYENVAFNMGGTRKAYALSSVDEYFAELTEAYLGENDYFPFNREQLQQFDPKGYELMKKAWEKPVSCSNC